MSGIDLELAVSEPVASGQLTYVHPVTSARALPGGPAGPTSIGSLADNYAGGFKWDSRPWYSDTTENRINTIPLNWDATTSGILTSYFQSGIGDNQDLEIQDIKRVPSSGLQQQGILDIWAPRVLHGYYYDYKTEGYLFSDDSEIVYVAHENCDGASGRPTISGFNEVILGSNTKVGIPIEARQYEYNQTTGKYDISIDVRKKIEFTGLLVNGERLSTIDSVTDALLYDNIDQENPEFIVLASGEALPRVIFNNQFSTEVGTGAVPSGVEILGYSTGGAGDRFNLQYSPVDSTQSIDIISFLNYGDIPVTWTAIGFDETPVGHQVKVDYDLGVIEFGDPSIAGQVVPSGGYTVGAHYWKTIKVEYEPRLSDDTVTGIESSVNPIYRRSPRGFIYLSKTSDDPTSIVLTADLSAIETDIYGPLTIGNAFANVIATVTDAQGVELEDQVVTFTITSLPAAGSFGLSDSTNAITDENGQAFAYYNPPRTINDIGEEILAANYSVDGMAQTTTLTTSNIFITGTADDITLYRVDVDDPVLGQLDVLGDVNDLAYQTQKYYEDYFLTESIYGPTGLVSSGLLSTGAANWEANWRLAHDLVRPAIFTPNSGEGRRTIIATLDATALNPHTFELGAVTPFQPTNIIDNGNGTYGVVFDTSTYTLPEPTASLSVGAHDTFYSYFLVAPSLVRIQASVFNSRLNRPIFSNEIEIRLSIPSYMNGVWTIDEINQVHIDEISSILSTITPSSQKVPLGFRLRSDGLTLAGALNAVTFLDVNPLYNADLWNPDEVVPISHQFNIDSIV